MMKNRPIHRLQAAALRGVAVCVFGFLASCAGGRQPDPATAVREHLRLVRAADTPEKRDAEKAWAADSLDFGVLDSLGMRDEYIAGWLSLYRESTGGGFDTTVTRAAKRLVLRAALRAPGASKQLVRTLCVQLAATKDYAPAAAIAAWPHGFDLPGNTYSAIADRLLGAVLLPGRRAPAVAGAAPMPTPTPAHTVVFFYESGCRSCGPIIDELIEAYPALQRRNVRVITVSSDKDRAAFDAYAEKFPWPDKLCDLRSFAGDNFVRWHVASTPTLYLVDGRGIVTGQFADLAQTGLLHTPQGTDLSEK